MRTIITLQDKTVINMTGKEVTPITTKVKITSKYATNARQEKEKVERSVFNLIDRGIEKAQRSINQRELRRAKRA